METKIIETVEAESAPLYSIRWGAIFASLVVGIGVQILLMLIGVAAGFAVYGSGSQSDGAIPLAALAWNGASLFIAALVGGYVAGRASGLRRSVDGVLHGLVSWGAALLFFIVATGSLTGNVVTGVLGMGGSGVDPGRASAMAELFADIEHGDRDATMRTLRDGFGLSPDQAANTADRALSMNSQGGEGVPSADPPAPTQSRLDLERASKMASAASTWLAIIVLLSLIASAGGGLLGAHGARQRALPGRHADHRIFRHRGSIPHAT
jgi:hypothetical protein